MNLMNKIRKEVKKVPRMTEKEKDELYFLNAAERLRLWRA